MKTYEYRSVPMHAEGWELTNPKSIPDLDYALNWHGERGWRFRSMTFSPSFLGEGTGVIVVFEREVTDARDE